MVFRDYEERDFLAKQKDSYAIGRFLLSKNIYLADKKVLDVGFGLGFNAKLMKELGAEVYGVEPSEEFYNFAIENNFISEDKAFNCNLQSLPDSFNETFDVVTIFLYNIPIKERKDVFDKLSQVVKDGGEIIIGMADEVYIKGDRFILPISEVAELFFDNVTLCRASDAASCNRYFLLAKCPKKNYVSKNTK